MALVQALFHPLSHVSRDETPNLINILSSKSILPESGLDNIIVQPKERLRRLLHPGILTREPGHKERVLTIRIELGVDGSLGKDGHLVRVEPVRHAPRSVFEREFCNQAPLGHDVDLRAARVRVRRVEAAGSEEAERHADSGADEGGEYFAVGADGVAAFAAGDGA